MRAIRLPLAFALAVALSVGLGLVPAAAQQPPQQPTMRPTTPPPGGGQSAVAPSAAITVRPELVIAGSSSMKPYVEEAAKALQRHYQLPAPKMQLEGSKKGIAAFCAGMGPAYPDIVVSSRRMHKDEFGKCIENGVLDIIEIRIGQSALFVVTDKGDAVFNVTPRMFYNALAAALPRKEDGTAHGPGTKGQGAAAEPAGTVREPPPSTLKKGEFDDNPNKTWRDADKAAPDLPIQVLVPVEASGTRNSFDALFMQGGCRRASRELDMIYSAGERESKCTTLRTDGAVVEVEEPYGPKMVELLKKAPAGTIAVMAGEVYTAFRDQLDVLTVNGVLPTDEAVIRFDYQIATGNYFYFKRGHMRNNAGVGVVRGIREFMAELTHDDMIGGNGVLLKLGLIAPTAREIQAERRKVKTLQRFTR